MSTGKNCMCLAFAMALSTIASAQDSLRYSTLSIGAGLSSLANKDQFQSPYTYRGTNALFNASLDIHRSRLLHVFDLSYSGGHTKSIVAPRTDNQLLFLSYDCLFKIPTKQDNRFVFSTGFGVHTLAIRTNYLPKVELSKKILSANVGLTWSANFLYHLNKRSDLRLNAALSLAGFAYRPDFEINGNDLGEAAFIGRNNLFAARLEYDHKLTRTLKLTAGFGYTYFSFDKPRPVIILQNGLSVGIRKTF